MISDGKRKLNELVEELGDSSIFRRHVGQAGYQIVLYRIIDETGTEPHPTILGPGDKLDEGFIDRLFTQYRAFRVSVREFPIDISDDFAPREWETSVKVRATVWLKVVDALAVLDVADPVGSVKSAIRSALARSIEVTDHGMLSVAAAARSIEHVPLTAGIRVQRADVVAVERDRRVIDIVWLRHRAEELGIPAIFIEDPTLRHEWLAAENSRRIELLRARAGVTTAGVAALPEILARYLEYGGDPHHPPTIDDILGTIPDRMLPDSVAGPSPLHGGPSGGSGRVRLLSGSADGSDDSLVPSKREPLRLAPPDESPRRRPTVRVSTPRVRISPPGEER